MNDSAVMMHVNQAEDRKCYQELEAYAESLPQRESSLIEILHRCQNLFGYIPRPAMEMIAKRLALPVSKVYGVVTFYSYFTEKPKGKYAFSVCLGTACYVKGAHEILEALQEELGVSAGDTTEDRLFSIVETRCLGDCANAPIVMVNDKVYSHMSPDAVRKLVRQYRKEEENA